MQKQRRLVIAAVAVAAMIALVAIFGHEDRASPGLGAAPGPWIPELQGSLADLTRLRLQSGAVVSTLVRGDSGWGVEERGGYPVDFVRLGGLLRELAETKRIEQKTSKPEFFARLGLEDVDKPDSKAVLVEIWRGGDKPAWRVLIGNSAEGRSGRYVRLADANETWLVDRSPQAFAEPTDWIDRQLIGIDFQRVARLERVLSDGEGFAAARTSKDAPGLVASAVPSGKKPRYETIFDAAARAVLNAEPEDVRRAPDAGFDAPDVRPAHNTLSMFDGLVLEIDALKGKDGDWIRISARVGDPVATEAPVVADPATASADAPAAPEAGSAQASAATPANVPADEAAKLNARLGGWAYKVSDYVYGELSKPLAEYVEDDKPAPTGDVPATDPHG